MRSSGLYRRDTDKLATTEFTFTRFFVPYLQDYKGWAVFCDCDFVWQVPTTELEQYCDDSKAVVCVQHDYTPKEGSIKMDGQVQTVYPRKNWSSMVLWNCAHPKNKILTPEVLNKETEHSCTAFSWLEDSRRSDPCHINTTGWWAGTRSPGTVHPRYCTTQKAVHGLMVTEIVSMPMYGRKISPVYFPPDIVISFINV
jgi:hypothetical protein